MRLIIRWKVPDNKGKVRVIKLVKRFYFSIFIIYFQVQHNIIDYAPVKAVAVGS